MEGSSNKDEVSVKNGKELATLGSRMRYAREYEGLTRKELASQIGKSKKTLQNWENDVHSPTEAAVDKIAAITGFKASWIRTGRGEMRPSAVVDTPTTSSRPDTVSSLPAVPIYDIEAQSGDGGAIVSESPLGHITPRSNSPIFEIRTDGSRMCYVVVHGDSMRPQLSPGQLAPVRRFDPPLDHIPEDGVYVFRYKNLVRTKRLKMLGVEDGIYRLRMISDNAAYGPEEITVDEATDFAVLGQVLT